ncbi:Nucleic acid-binding [Forsythia ovata]|uniref:Nucleic acid-binding n=1 Tax=Forsythia ovata TaxID=205694 RepID=A0ABD1WBM1_9LAMI
MADQKKKQFTKVNELRPLDTGLNLTVKVVNAKMIAPRGRPQGRLAECLVGDETGMIIFTARYYQVDLMKGSNTLVLSNAKIDVFKGSMRLVVDRSGHVEVGEPASFSVQEDNNMSLIEFERIAVLV